MQHSYFTRIRLDNNRDGLGCGFACNWFIWQKRDAISCCVTKKQFRTRWRTGDGGGRVDRKGLDSGRDRTAVFLILISKGFLFLRRNISYFNTETMSSGSTLILVGRHQIRTFGPVMWVWLPYYCRLTRDSSN